MQDKKYAIVGLCMLGIAFAFTIYTVLVASGLFDDYDDDKITIKIEPRTIVYYFIAVCFVTSIIYRIYDKRKRANNKVSDRSQKFVLNTKDRYPYSDLFN